MLGARAKPKADPAVRSRKRAAEPKTCSSQANDNVRLRSAHTNKVRFEVAISLRVFGASGEEQRPKPVAQEFAGGVCPGLTDGIFPRDRECSLSTCLSSLSTGSKRPRARVVLSEVAVSVKTETIKCDDDGLKDIQYAIAK